MKVVDWLRFPYRGGGGLGGGGLGRGEFGGGEFGGGGEGLQLERTMQLIQINGLRAWWWLRKEAKVQNNTSTILQLVVA